MGGTGALVAAKMLGPRLGRWDDKKEPAMGSATNAIIGVFMIWWAWVAFNQVKVKNVLKIQKCEIFHSQGATFGISGKRWIFAIRATITSLLASFAGGMVGLIYSLFTRKGKTEVMLASNGILAGTVSIMAGCVR